MMPVIFQKTYGELPFCEKEILRYVGCKTPDPKVGMLLQDCVRELRGKLNYRVCWCQLPLSISDDCCDFGVFSLSSVQLAANLQGCESVLLFGATVGMEMDRLIARYGRLSPARGLIMQAIGAERIEGLCDAFCQDMASQLDMELRPRFSPGYGDLPLTVQKDIFSVLDCEKRIGLFLNNSLLMSPSKSVTAFAGLTREPDLPRKNKCSLCDKTDCVFRGAL